MDGWGRLLNDTFFAHEGGELDVEDARRLLEIIGIELFSRKVSFSIENKSFTVPENRAEVIGSKAQRAAEGLKQLIGETAPDTKDTWVSRFQTEQGFQAYVFHLLDFLMNRARNNLPEMEQLSTDTRSEMQAKRDSVNADELEREVARAEEARKAVEEARRAVEEAQKAAEDAKRTAEIQLSRVKAARKAANNAVKASETARTASTAAKATADSIMPNMLTTLGVFVAIIIAVVACYLSVLLSQHTGVVQGEEGPLSLAALLLMGHILLNVIFLLLYLISKMSVHTLACHCLVGDRMDCQECDRELRGQCRLRHKLWLRYPYVVAMNGAFAAAYCGLGLWQLVRSYFGTAIDQKLTENSLYAAALVAAVAILIIVAVIFVFQFFLRSPRQSLEAKKKRADRQGKKEIRKMRKTQKRESERKVIRELRDKVKQHETDISRLENMVGELRTELKTLARDAAPEEVVK